DSEKAEAVLSGLYAPFVRTGNPLMFMDITSAELTKYAANAMLATRISFMNQIAELCEAFGADVDSVRKGLGSDPRIGKYFLFPGPGYGGSCFPKDVKALIRAARADNIPIELLTATESVNQRQKKKLFEMVRGILGKRLAGARVAVWGLAFKAETDDVRESASLELVDALLEARVTVAAHDPAAIENARAKFGNRIEYFQDMYAAVEGAEALVVVTEWRQFRNPDFARIRAALQSPTIVDGRNLYDPRRMRELGFSYHSIGRRPLK
ncbi:MAG: nucleotide sugar dehydrogenase, partial [Gemmatimonadales bacterium]